ncbi:MAG: pyrroline-5-carboxylate reductase [Selenomonadaceae bacterium]|nr:pyrroline-5-carboxylate reductase [Selenomonadaceae bacterium]
MKIGFIGGGALAEMVIRGITKNFIEPSNIYVAERRQERCDELNRLYNVNAQVKAEFFSEIDILIIAVKPKDARSAMNEISSKVKSDTVIVSVVAGFQISRVEEHFISQPVIRVMPNVAISVSEGMSAFVRGKNAKPADVETFIKIWSNLGRFIEVDEKLMDAVTGLSGSGPAYAFLMIDALSDGGVAAGLSRSQAIELAAQTLLGAAKMVLETNNHPDVLRDKVTSPAGTTIEGVRVLEKCGVRSALIEAVIAATEKSKAL